MENTTIPSQPTAQQEADIFRQQASRYMVCFPDGCSRHEACLHWLVGQYVNEDAVVLQSVNLRNRLVRQDQCPLFRPKVYGKQKRGMLHFYDDMPGRIERAVRLQLIHIFNRKVYYQMRNGQRPISPDEQQQIAAVCQRYGWTGPLSYDSEEEGFVW